MSHKKQKTADVGISKFVVGKSLTNEKVYNNYTDSQNENFFFLHEQISNFLKGHDLLVTNRPKKNFPRV